MRTRTHIKFRFMSISVVNNAMMKSSNRKKMVAKIIWLSNYTSLREHFKWMAQRLINNLILNFVEIFHHKAMQILWLNLCYSLRMKIERIIDENAGRVPFCLYFLSSTLLKQPKSHLYCEKNSKSFVKWH